jgi:hypothetical protein
MGAALVVYDEAVQLVEDIFEDQAGEVDEGTEAAEGLLDRLGGDALEHLCRFVRFLGDGQASITRERERLAKAEARIASRLAWAEAKGVELLASLGKKSRAVGPFRAAVRIGSKRLEVDAALFDLDTAPDAIVRIKPAIEARRELDKSAAKAWLEDADELPVPGLAVVRGPSRFLVD